jgi:hypothetical protein
MKKILLSLSAVLIFLAVSITLLHPSPAHAAFNANNLIDDLTFDNVNSMSPIQIDGWLNTYFPSSCISTNHGFQAVDPIGYSHSSGYIYGGNVSAGQVIYDAAQAYGVNPQVLLATLQKEQSLISGGAGCSTLAYAGAMGYGCPDSGTTHTWTGVSLYTLNGTTVTSVSGTCVNGASIVGFSQQVINAAWLLKFGEQRSEGKTSWAVIKGAWDNTDDLARCYGGPMTQGSFKRCPSDPSPTFYDGLVTIDGSSTHMDNGATAALYWYTPHFSGNQHFDSIFNQYFGIQYANDTYSPHPNGTLISLGGQVHLIENGVKRWITNGDVFNSYGYPWFQVKIGSTGDAGLAQGPDINTLAPGTIFRTDNSPVYVITYESGTLVKQQISAVAFDSLGYSWNEVVYVPPGNVLAATASSILFASQHPAGTLVAGGGKAYLLGFESNQLVKRWIVNPDAFMTNNFDWGKVKNATPDDLALPDGTSKDLRQGNMLIYGGNIYLVDYDSTGILMRPVGPWECFADRWHYAYRDLYQTVAVPARIGSLATC